MPKRGVINERIVPDLVALEAMTHRHAEDYKVYKDLALRDQALLAFLILTGCRIHEALKIKKYQVVSVSWDLAQVENVITGKRQPADSVRPEIPLPRRGGLAPFTSVFFAWYDKIPGKTDYLFPRASRFGIHWDKPLSRQAAYRKIRAMTGKYPHYFRSVCETIYGRIFKSGYMMKDFFNLASLASTERYVKTRWKDDLSKILDYGEKMGQIV